MRYYRLVSDYGWSDKCWAQRMIPESQIVDQFNEWKRTEFKTLEELPSHPDFIHYIEDDDENDEEGWDPEDN